MDSPRVVCLLDRVLLQSCGVMLYCPEKYSPGENSIQNPQAIEYLAMYVQTDKFKAFNGFCIYMVQYTYHTHKRA